MLVLNVWEQVKPIRCPCWNLCNLSLSFIIPFLFIYHDVVFRINSLQPCKFILIFMEVPSSFSTNNLIFYFGKCFVTEPPLVKRYVLTLIITFYY